MWKYRDKKLKDCFYPIKTVKKDYITGKLDSGETAFVSLLKSLTMTSRMTLISGDGANFKIVSIVTALNYLAASATSLFEKDGGGVGKNGEKETKFAIETCLLV
jgi:hypothetical protein